jgi:hypothetical protein
MLKKHQIAALNLEHHDVDDRAMLAVLEISAARPRAHRYGSASVAYST